MNCKLKFKTSDITLSALFTAVIVVISQISFMLPIGVPITLQTFAIALCGYILGAKLSVVAVVTYIFTGMVGLPVFSGFRGGVQHLTGPTGGFIIGFIVLGLMCGISNNLKGNVLRFLLGFSGLLLCHIIGIIQFSVLSNIGFGEAFITVSFPFIIKDILLLFFAQLFSGKLKSIIFKKYK